jgi:nitrate/TMAO reductase-like tetraheme cytochrome c subunit
VNPLSLAGAALTTASALAFITFYVIEALGLIENPYAGIIGYVLFPALFVLGLLLIPLGIWREGRRRSRGRAAWRWPVLDLGSPSTRRTMAGVVVLTLVNIGLVSVAGFGAGHYMESNNFCGQVCHEPMKPQFTAHQVGPHASVGCVSCHIGPGAKGAIKAKLAGTRQLWQVAAHNFPRPIHSGGRVPAAAETCITCHRAGFTARDTTKVIREYADDAANTETVTTLDLQTRKTHDAHARAGVNVEYAVSASDPNVVTYVRAVRDGGSPTEFFAPGTTAAPSGALRRMDCLDCHSRPAHAFGETAERAVDNAMAGGQFNRAVPFVRREVIAALKADFATEPAAMAGIGKQIADFYATNGGASAADVAAAIEGARRLYRANVFPEMKVTWGTHVVQNSHINSPGCFRCHSDELKSPAGPVIKQDC